GPPGVGKRAAAVAFAAELLGSPERVERRAHPDLYILEPLGDQIRIDAIRELRRDLHMRPFEADRRVYLVLGADLMNEDAADALLKDLEEPPSYAVLVLVANDLGPLLEVIRARGSAAREAAHEALDGLELPAREAEQRVRRAQRGAEREEFLATLEELAAWYRDLLVVGAGADGAVVHSDRLDELRE